MSTSHAVGRAVRRALSSRSDKYASPFHHALLAVAATAFAQVAVAQQATTTPEKPEEKSTSELSAVTVVGSRLRHDTFNSPSPVQMIDREESTLAGLSTTTELLQGTGVTNGSAQINNAFGGFVTDGGPGANTLSLRGLGAGRTLVLINGRRVSPAGTRGAVGSADLNVLPHAIIDQIEILRDGASSIYGSDAIAGVVNVITKPKPTGISFEGSYKHPFEDGGEQTRFSVVGGTAGDGWSLSGSLDYYERGDLKLGDRDWTQCNVDGRRNPATGASLDFIDPLTGRPKCYPITGTGSNGVTINTIGTQNITAANSAGLGLIGPVVGAAGSSGTTFNRFRPNSGVSTGVIGFEGVGGGTNNINVRDTFDPRMLNRSLISPEKTLTAFVQSSSELGDFGELYTEFLGTQRRSSQVSYRQLSMDYRKGSPVIPASLAFSTFGADQGTSGGLQVGVRAFIGFGNDLNEQQVDYYRPLVGIRGDLFFGNWRYDLYAMRARSSATYAQQSFLTDKITNASDVIVAPVGTNPSLVRNGFTCRINTTNPAERCVPFPMLNSQTIAGVLPGDFRDYIFRGVEGRTKYDETVFSGTIDGDVFSLPAGEIKALLGVEYRKAKINDTPDPNSIAGNLYNLTTSTPTRGKDDVKEVFTEVDVPILKDLTLVNELTFTGSYRFTEYDSYGSDTTYKLGATFSPVDWVAFRYSKGTSFRAPALFEQYQGATSGFLSQAGDPCNNYAGAAPARFANCASENLPNGGAFNATSGIRVLSEGGAAAGLESETSDNVTFGVVVKPPLGDFGDLAIAVDYFDIEINNGVDQAGAANILALCYDNPGFRAAGGFCRLVTRDPSTYQLTVSNAYTNIATQIAKGVDYTVRFETEVGKGKVLLNSQVTRYISQANKLFEDDPLTEFNNTIGTPKWSGNMDISYTVGDWRFFYGIDWIDDTDSYEYLEEDPETSIFDFHTGDYFKHSASVRYSKDDWQTTVGVRNFLDEEPPTITQGFYNRVGNAPLYSGYDYVGRQAFIEITKAFK